MFALTFFLASFISARAAEPLSFRNQAYAALNAAADEHGLRSSVESEAALRALSDRLAQLHEVPVTPLFGWVDPQPAIMVATAAMIWLRPLTAIAANDRTFADRKLAGTLGRLIGQAIDSERPVAAADALRKATEKTFRHGLRVAKIIANVDPSFAELVALGQIGRLQNVFTHVADTVQAGCATLVLEGREDREDREDR